MSDTEDILMDDEPVPSTFDKGKGKALDAPGQSASFGEDNLPWYAIPCSTLDVTSWPRIRVEKYRPVTLDDVVSHKDIVGTRTSYTFASSV